VGAAKACDLNHAGGREAYMEDFGLSRQKKKRERETLSLK
jgi:hypothetical protein